MLYAPGYYIPGKTQQGSVSWQADSTKHLTEQEGADSAKYLAEQEEADSAKYLTEAEGLDNGQTIGMTFGKMQDADLHLQRQYRAEALALAAACDTVIFIGGLNHD